MKKSLLITIITLSLFVGILSAPAMAYAKTDCNFDFNNLANTINSGTSSRIISISRQDLSEMLTRLNNWYANLINTKEEKAEQPADKTDPEDAVPAPQPEPERPAPAPQPEPKPETRPVPQDIGSQQFQMLETVNQERIKAGLKALAWDASLANVAQVKAKDMTNNNYFNHNSPTYGSPFDMMKKFGINYRAAGENLAGSSSVERAHVGLMNSEGHRKNILNSNFTHIGIGVEESSRYGYVYVQMFIGK